VPTQTNGISIGFLLCFLLVEVTTSQLETEQTFDNRYNTECLKESAHGGLLKGKKRP
jgi:hypothetical protein